MSNIDPTQLDIGTTLVVDDNTSGYDGTRGDALQIYEDSIILELERDGPGSIIKSFDIDQLAFPE